MRPTSAGSIGRYGTSHSALPLRFLGALRGEALLDRVLVRAGERGEDELAGIRMPRMHRQRRAVLGGADDGADVGEIELRIDALRVQVHRQRDEAHVAGALAIAEQAAFDAIRARHHRELRRGDAGAAIVVRMHGHDDAVAPAQVAVHPFDLVGVDVRRRDLDRRRQVEDDRMRASSAARRR